MNEDLEAYKLIILKEYQSWKKLGYTRKASLLKVKRRLNNGKVRKNTRNFEALTHWIDSLLIIAEKYNHIKRAIRI